MSVYSDNPEQRERAKDSLEESGRKAFAKGCARHDNPYITKQQRADMIEFAPWQPAHSSDNNLSAYYWDIGWENAKEGLDDKDNPAKVSSMNQETLKPVVDALNSAFWFGGQAIYPFHHPVNKIKDCVMIYLDGSPQMKFQAHKNGKLRLRKVFPHSRQWFDLGLRMLETVTIDELAVRIRRKRKYSVKNMQKKGLR